ncbi:MAG TPA: PAS domain-containing protein [Ohtaekwangia sp.]
MVDYLKLLFESGEDSSSFNEKISDFFPALIYVYDVDKGKVKYINRKLTDILGYSFEEFKATDDSLLNLVFKEDVERVRLELEKLASLKDNESHSYGCRLNRKEGSWRHFKTMGTVLRRNAEGKASSLLFVAQDITDELKTEEEIRATRELFEETEQLLQFGTWNWHLETDRIEWTKGLYDILEYKPSEIEKVTHDFYMKHVSEEHREEFQRILDQAIATQTEFEFEYIVNSKNNKQKSVSTKGKVVANENGKVIRIVGITRDITALKGLERERERIILELNRSNHDLEEFAYVASHDLQEPLRKISTFSERLRTKYNDVLQQEGNQYLTRIMASSESMRLLIDNLLEFSRTSRSTFEYVPVNLNEILNESLSDLELKIEETRAAIKVSPLPVIDAMPMEIRQLFGNIINNALKFRRADVNPVLIIKTEEIRPGEREKYLLAKDRTYHKIVFVDNGIGFEQEYAERIFQIFQRLHGKAEYAGAGVGLAICKKIAENHDGFIYASSTGEGAVFTIILPEKQY